MKKILSLFGSTILSATSFAGIAQLNNSSELSNYNYKLNTNNDSLSFDQTGYSDYLMGWGWQDSSIYNNTNAQINYHWGSRSYSGGLDYTKVDLSSAPVSDQWTQYKSWYIFSSDIMIGFAEVRMNIVLQCHKGNDGKYNIRYKILNTKTDWSGSYAHFWGHL